MKRLIAKAVGIYVCLLHPFFIVKLFVFGYVKGNVLWGRNYLAILDFLAVFISESSSTLSIRDLSKSKCKIITWYMVFTNYFAAILMWNWIFVNAWTQPSQNEVTSLIFVRKHFQDLAIEKTGWSYMYTGRKQSDWSLWTWNGHNYFSVNKTREHTDTGPEPILQKSLTKSKWLETMSLRYNRRLNSKQMRKSSVGNLDLILLVTRNKMFAIFSSLWSSREEHYFPPHAANFPSCTKYWHLKYSLVE